MAGMAGRGAVGGGLTPHAGGAAGLAEVTDAVGIDIFLGFSQALHPGSDGCR